MKHYESLLVRCLRTVLMIPATLFAIAASGNPVQVPQPTSVRRLELVAENVIVTIGPSHSRVIGDYRFRAAGQLKGVNRMSQSDIVEHYDRRAADPACIAIPVILPPEVSPEAQSYPQVERYFQLQSAKPEAIVNDRKYAGLGMVLPHLDEMADRIQKRLSLPDGWKPVFFEFTALPFDASRNELDVRISYIQPHLPGNISAYLPILPDDAVRTNYLITFQAGEGVRFAPADHYDIVGHVSDTNVSVRPVGLQLLKIQIAPESVSPSLRSSSGDEIRPPGPATRVSSVVFSGGSDGYTLTINGTGFGRLPHSMPFNGVTPYFRLFEVAQLGAGEWGYPGDAKLLGYESWSDTQIQINGLAAQPGDAIQLWVSNPATGSSATWGGNVPGGLGIPQRRSMRRILSTRAFDGAPQST